MGFSFGKMLGGIPVVGDMAKGAYDATIGGAGDLYNDYMNVGKTHYSDPGLNLSNDSNNNANQGFNTYMGRSTWAQNQAQADRGPQAVEDAGLAGNWNGAYGTQGDAVNLAKNAANGNAPSAAQGQLQTGLNAAMAQQQAIAGGARGSAGLALAGTNAAANSANIAQQGVNQAAMLRAQEMGQARELYGNLANQQTNQAAGRLQIGNQNNQFNANLNDQYRIGMGQLANQYGQTGLGYNQSLNQGQRNQIDLYNAQQDRAAGINTGNAAARAGQTNALYGFLGGVGNTAFSAAGSGKA